MRGDETRDETQGRIISLSLSLIEFDILLKNFLLFCVNLAICYRCKQNQHFELLFFMISLHFGTSNYLFTYRKTSLILKNVIYLVLSSLEIQRKVIQTKYTTFLTL